MPVLHSGAGIIDQAIDQRTTIPEDYRLVRTVSARDIECPACGVGADQDCVSGLKSVPKRKNGPRVSLLCPERIALARKMAAEGDLEVEVKPRPEAAAPRTESCGCILGVHAAGGVNSQKVKIPCRRHLCKAMKAIKGQAERCSGMRADGSEFCRNHKCLAPGCPDRRVAGARYCEPHKLEAERERRIRAA